MSIITFRHKGNFDKTVSFFEAARKKRYFDVLGKYAQEGVDALSRATPKDTGLAASSWYYELGLSGGYYSITWLNSDIENGFPVAIKLQYGHGTGTGGYVQGVDYINPAIKPVFDKIAAAVWKEVQSL